MSTGDELHDLKKLISKRKSIKSHLTIVERFLEENKNDGVTCTSKTLKTNLARLIEKQKHFDEIQEEIDFLTNNSEDQFKIRETIENSFNKLVAQVEELITTFENNINSDIKPIVKTEHSNIKLPPIDLPTFDGNYANWCSFDDAFCAFVDKNDSLSDVQKLCYLRSQLKGEAFELIRFLETTAQNYTVAFNIVRDRFNHHRRIVYSHVNTLLNIKFSTAKSFINTIDQHMQCLSSLNIQLKDYHALLVPLFVSKLDPKLSREWESKIVSYPRSTLPSYDEFRDFMLLKAETNDIINYSKEVNKHSFTYTSPKSKMQTTTYLSTTTTCPLCNDSHFIYQCPQFLKQNANTRFKTAKSKNLCTNFLRKGYFVKNCKSSKCKHCQKSHNTLLHINTSQATPIDTQPCNSQMDATPQSPLQTLTSTASNNSSQEFVLLPTAEVYVLDKHGKKHIARALLDSASQSSFITHRLAKKLDLPKHPIDISVSGIDQNSLPIKHRTEITFESKHGDFTTDLSCLLLDHITSNLPHLSFSSKTISIPDYVNLADIRYNEAREIDILLGADIFWDLLLD